MRHQNLNYSFYAGAVISLIGLMGAIGWLDIPALRSYMMDIGPPMALSTAIAFIFMGIGVMLSLGPPAPEPLKAGLWKKSASTLLLIPICIALYNTVFYLFLARFQVFKPFLEDFPQVSMAFLTALNLCLAAGGLWVFNRYPSTWWAPCGLGIISLFIIEVSVFALLGHWTDVPILFSFIQAYPTAIAFILISLALLHGTIPYQGLVSPLFSSSRKIQGLSLLGVVVSGVILIAGIIIVNLFYSLMAPGANVNKVAELIVGFEFSTIALSILVFTLSLRVIYFYASSLRMEEALKGSLEELISLKQAIDSSSIVAVTDAQGVIKDVNDAFCAISRYSREALIGQSYDLINSSYHPAEFFQELWLTIEQGGIWKGEIRNRAKDGTFYWVNTTICPFFDGNSRPVRYIAIQHDITPLKIAETELKANAYRQKILALLGQHALSGMEMGRFFQRASVLTARALKAPLCKILELLPSGKEFLLRAGYGWHEGLIGNVKVPAGPDSQGGFTLLMDEPVVVEDFGKETRFNEPLILETHHVVSGMNVIIHGESPDRPFGVLGIHATESRHFGPDDVAFLQSVANVLAMAIERKQAEILLRKFNEELEKRVTERTCQLEEARQESEEANRLKTRVLAFVSHDFKNPLSAMGRFVKMLDKGDNGLTPYQHELISYLGDGIAQLRAMVTDILDKARMEEGKLTLSLEWVEIRPVLDELKPVMQSLAMDRQVTVTYVIDPDFLGLEADPRFLRQIILNLLSNAIKYNKRRGEVILKIQETPNHQFASIEVQDTGLGIPADKIPEIFNDYFRVGTASYDQIEGTGLGLAFIKKLIDMHGGQITVTSQVGAGSTFTVLLPNHVPKALPSLNGQLSAPKTPIKNDIG